jgi:hypothetical protein
VTAVSIVAPLLIVFLAAGLFVQRWSLRLWFSLTIVTVLILVVNLVFLFR